MKNKTAILVFANSAEKQLTSKSNSSAQVFELLIAKTLRIVKKTDLPYFYFPENKQVGKTFGERFKNAIEAVYDKGFKNVISVGTDIPHLTSSHILKAESKLKQNDFVLGPSTDGGFYLMGFTKNHFGKLSFLDLSWESNALQRNLKTKLQQLNASFSYLETLSDLDEASDIKLILQSFRQLSKHLKKILSTIQDTLNSISDVILFHLEIIFCKLYFNKGSPVLLHI